MSLSINLGKIMLLLIHLLKILLLYAQSTRLRQKSTGLFDSLKVFDTVYHDELIKKLRLHCNVYVKKNVKNYI